MELSVPASGFPAGWGSGLLGTLLPLFLVPTVGLLSLSCAPLSVALQGPQDEVLTAAWACTPPATTLDAPQSSYLWVLPILPLRLPSSCSVRCLSISSLLQEAPLGLVPSTS